jgi:hypothetical protein
MTPVELYLSKLEQSLQIPDDRKCQVLTETRLHLEEAVADGLDANLSQLEAEHQAVLSFGDLDTYRNAMTVVHEGGTALDTVRALVPAGLMTAVLLLPALVSSVNPVVFRALCGLFALMMVVSPVVMFKSVTGTLRSRLPSHATTCWLGVLSTSWSMMLSIPLLQWFLATDANALPFGLGLFFNLAAGAAVNAVVTRQSRLHGISLAIHQAFPFLLLYHLTPAAGAVISFPLVLSCMAYAVATAAFVQGRGTTRIKMLLGAGCTMLFSALLQAILCLSAVPCLFALGMVVGPLFFAAFMGTALAAPEAQPEAKQIVGFRTLIE